jgi:hypothetical protein
MNGDTSYPLALFPVLLTKRGNEKGILVSLSGMVEPPRLQAKSGLAMFRRDKPIWECWIISFSVIPGKQSATRNPESISGYRMPDHVRRDDIAAQRKFSKFSIYHCSIKRLQISRIHSARPLNPSDSSRWSLNYWTTTMKHTSHNNLSGCWGWG